MDIGHNRLEEIPSSLFELKDCLKDLIIPGNRIKIDSFGDKWGDMVTLTKIDLENNVIGSVPEALFELPSLTHLNLNRNELKSIPEGLFSMKSLKCGI